MYCVLIDMIWNSSATWKWNLFDESRHLFGKPWSLRRESRSFFSWGPAIRLWKRLHVPRFTTKYAFLTSHIKMLNRILGAQKKADKFCAEDTSYFLGPFEFYQCFERVNKKLKGRDTQSTRFLRANEYDAWTYGKRPGTKSSQPHAVLTLRVAQTKVSNNFCSPVANRILYNGITRYVYTPYEWVRPISRTITEPTDKSLFRCRLSTLDQGPATARLLGVFNYTF